MRVARLLFLTLALAMILDVCSPAWFGNATPKRWLTLALGRIGLWQGQWVMFSPNPVLNNAWYSLEVERAEGEPETVWISPAWQEASGWERFRRFREMNYFSRLCADRNHLAARDFTDWLLREHGFPDDQPAALKRFEMHLLYHEPGIFPRPADQIEILKSQLLIDRNQARRAHRP
jgi:hypothetical protein